MHEAAAAEAITQRDRQQDHQPHDNRGHGFGDQRRDRKRQLGMDNGQRDDPGVRGCVKTQKYYSGNRATSLLGARL
jgi:hypothetical protein